MELQILPLEDGSRREFTALTDIPEQIKRAFIVSEDKRFFSHTGIDIIALLRAVMQNILEGETVSGASTITMQLARIISPHGPDIWGKFYEIINSFRIESRLSKAEILELWLNSIPFGYRATGITTAGKVFFGKELEQLTEIESLILSIIPRRPSVYNPKEYNGQLKTAVFRLAERRGISITESEFKKTLNSANENAHVFTWPFHVPHFINYIN